MSETVMHEKLTHLFWPPRWPHSREDCITCFPRHKGTECEEFVTQDAKGEEREREGRATGNTDNRDKKERLPQIIGKFWVDWTAATPSWNSQTQANICFVNSFINNILRKIENKISPRAHLWSGSMCERLFLAEYKVGASVVYCFVHQSIWR